MRSLAPIGIPLLFAAALGAQGPDPSDAARLLAREHVAGAATVRLEFRVHDACDELLAADPAVRQRAGDYLHALLVELDAAARAVRDADAASDSSDRERAMRNVHRDLARRLRDLPLRPGTGECEAPLLWLWRHGGDGEQRADAIGVLAGVRTPATDRLFQAIVADGSSVPAALCHALAQIDARGLPVDVKLLAPLCQHHREDVRTWARHLCATRGVAPPAAGPEGEPPIGPALERVLRLAASLTPCEVPADAPWVALTLPARPQEGWHEAHTWHGWLLHRGSDTEPWRLLTAYGELLEQPLPGATIEASTLARFGATLVAQRTTYDATEDTDVKRAIAEQQGLRRAWASSADKWAGSPAELLVAAWSFARGDRATTAGVLLPLLETAADENDLLRPMLHELAAQLDEAMLVAFASADYPRALALAGKLASPELAGFEHHERARELAAQLPARGDDFHALQLPTPQRWRELQRELPRAAQIEHLVQRLRLLRCQQMSNPGGISYAQPQHGAATAVDRPGVDPRVNPFVELLQLNLKSAELPLLLPALESRDYVLAFDLQRFLPQRPQSLHRVAWVAATVCNEVAQEGIVDPRRFLGTDAERQAARAQLITFAQRHGNRTAADRLAERMKEVDDWQEIRRAFWNLNTFDPVRAAVAMRDVGRAHPERLPEIVRLLALLDRAEFVGEAREWLRADDADQSFFAALLLLRHRQEPDAAFRVIAERLDGDGAAALVPAATDALHACELPAAKDLLRALLAGTHGCGYRPSPAFVQRLVRAGWPEAREALADALAGKRRLPSRYDDGTLTDAQARLAILYEASTWWPDVVVELRDDDAAGLDAAAAKLQQRLDADWQRIQRGEAPAMVAAEPELPWGELLSFSTGWIRRM